MVENGPIFSVDPGSIAAALKAGAGWADERKEQLLRRCGLSGFKALIAEDERTSAALVERALQSAGFAVTVTQDGVQAARLLASESFDVLITDWMMPNMDGIELCRKARSVVKSPLLIVMVTALSFPQARSHALQAGADDFLTKPVRPQQLVSTIQTLLARRAQPAPAVRGLQGEATQAIRGPANPPPFIGVGILASTGGPAALLKVLPHLQDSTRACYLLVQHGPAWMLESFVETAQRSCKLPVHLAEHGMTLLSNNVYVAPGDWHMSVTREYTLALDESPPENFVRPAADPLFRSIARAFGRWSVVTLMTGMGRDGSVGAEAVRTIGGAVVAQDPATAVAASIPQTAIGAGITSVVVPLDKLAETITQQAREKFASLRPVGV